MPQYLPGSVNKYSYELPDERIARFPLEDPSASKLLVYDRGNISHSEFRSLPEFINGNELMVFNNTKVVQARIIMNKPTGSRIEIFLLEPLLPAEYELAFSSGPGCRWKCLIGNKKKWKSGPLSVEFKLGDQNVILKAEMTGEHISWQEIEFHWEPRDIPFGRVIDGAGLTPIPPYLKRSPREVDKKRYQTIYSRIEGSVAAPTAGLHFTGEVLQNLRKNGTGYGEVTLHVGAGTFRPVKAELYDQHEMHTEHFSVPDDTIHKLLSYPGRVVAVGTTTARTLESLHWLGARLIQAGVSPGETLSQGEAGKLDARTGTDEALSALLSYLKAENKSHIISKTQLMITPGYRFQIINRLITNFHQPRSTLLLLIAAFIGEDWRRVYEYALRNDFRFLSYGDSSLLTPAGNRSAGGRMY